MPGPAEREFGRYLLIEKIKSGAMGSVWLGRHKPPLDKLVAIKILLSHLAEQESFVRRFEREARTAARLQHANIVQVYDYGEYGGEYFLAMEYVRGVNPKGPDLATWLETHAPLPTEVSLAILNDVSAALDFAHTGADPVIHRDLKPGNILMSVLGDVKLTDFGLARAAHDDDSLTRTGDTMGTVPYMSPEQTRGDKLDGKTGRLSDIFSMGIICYELLGGKRPFLGETRSAIEQRIREWDPPVIQQLNPLLPEAIAALVRSMLEKEAQRRPDMGTVSRQFESAVAEIGANPRSLLRDYVHDPNRQAELLRAKRSNIHFRREEHNVDANDGTWVLPSDKSKGTTQPTPTRKPPRPPSPVIRPQVLALVATSILLVTAIVVLLMVVIPRGREVPPPDPSPPPVPGVSRDTVPSHPSIPAVASITLTTQPPAAKASIDGGPARNTPTSFSDLPAGEHRLVVSAERHRSRDLRLMLAPGQDTTLSIALTPSAPADSGDLTIDLKPAATCIVDGNLRFANVSSLTLHMPAGPHRVRAEHRDYDPKEWGSVTVEPRKERALAWDFDANAGRVRIVSETDVAGWIWVNGRETGLQAPQVMKLRSGDYRILLMREGYRSAEGEQTVTIETSRTKDLRFHLERIQ